MTAGLINKTGNYVIQNGADFLLVIIPSKEDVYPEKYFKNLQIGYDFGLPANTLANSLAKFDIVNLRECLKNYSGSLYYETDGHLTPLGHQAVSSCLMGEIAKKAHSKV